MEQVTYTKNADKNIEIISNKGAFLTTLADGKLNTMTIGWATLGYMWKKPIITVLVRPSRYTYELIEKSGEFTVSVPYEDMQKQLDFCGVKSGRTTDKFAELNLKIIAGTSIKTPLINFRGMHYECKTLYKTPLLPDMLDSAISSSAYPNGNYHTMYFGEILNAVEIE